MPNLQKKWLDSFSGTEYGLIVNRYLQTNISLSVIYLCQVSENLYFLFKYLLFNRNKNNRLNETYRASHPAPPDALPLRPTTRPHQIALLLRSTTKPHQAALLLCALPRLHRATLLLFYLGPTRRAPAPAYNQASLGSAPRPPYN